MYIDNKIYRKEKIKHTSDSVSLKIVLSPLTRIAWV